MYFTQLPDHSRPDFDEDLHFSRFKKQNIVFNALSTQAGCDNHIGCLSFKKNEFASAVLKDAVDAFSLDNPINTYLEFFQTLYDIDPALNQNLNNFITQLDTQGYYSDDVGHQRLLPCLPIRLRRHAAGLPQKKDCMPTIHLLIKGTVQGVNYRYSAKEQADRLSINGWVRNTPEGHVEITATGTPSALDRFTTWCRRGPSHATVTAVESTPLPETPFDSFQIRRG